MPQLTASQLVKRLQEEIAAHGDGPVYFEPAGAGNRIIDARAWHGRILLRAEHVARFPMR